MAGLPLIGRPPLQDFPPFDNIGWTGPWRRWLTAITNQVVICTQATFPNLKAIPQNTYLYVSDFNHLILFNGVDFVFADEGNRYYVVADQAPAKIGWHLADGTVVQALNPDGTVSNVTPSNSPDVIITAAPLNLASRLWFRL